MATSDASPTRSQRNKRAPREASSKNQPSPPSTTPARPPTRLLTTAGVNEAAYQTSKPPTSWHAIKEKNRQNMLRSVPLAPSGGSQHRARSLSFDRPRHPAPHANV